MKTVKFELSPQESFVLNNILVENSMSMVEVVNAQPTKERAQQAMQLLKMYVTAQQYLFDNVAKQYMEFSENVLNLYKKIVEDAHTSLALLKEEALEKGDLKAFNASDMLDILDAILKKIPEQSRIIV